MTFNQFLQLLGINFLSNTLPLCVSLFITFFFIIKYFEKRITALISFITLDKSVNKKDE
jgi:hypothetical protein